MQVCKGIDAQNSIFECCLYITNFIQTKLCIEIV